MKTISGVKNYCYEEDNPIGRGGFATVYKGKCLDKCSNCDRAIRKKCQYQEDKPIGRGDCAYVSKGKCLDDCSNSDRAIKKISIVDRKWERHREYVEREIKIHKSLKHDNIVKLHEVIYEEDAIYLVLELCNCSLADLLKKVELEEAQVYYLFKQIVNGLQYLHNKGYIHRDLTLSNILLTNDRKVRIADFNLSTSMNEEVQYTVVGTRGFQAPEVKRKTGHTDKADCYSLGCILYALFYGNPPKEGKIDTYPYISNEAKELLQNLLESNPNKRFCIEEVPNSKFWKKCESASKSKCSEYRSDDSGNGSRKHLTSLTEKKSRSRSRDSGFNSKNTSSNKSRSKLVERPALSLQKDQLLTSQKYFLTDDRTHDRKRSASEDRKPYMPWSHNNHLQVYNSRERSASEERKRIENLKLPNRKNYLNNAHQGISSDYYKSGERYKNNDYSIDSAWTTQQSCDPGRAKQCYDPSCRFSNSLLEGQYKVPSSTCSHGGCFDIKCSHVSACCCHSHDYKKRHLANINNPEKLKEPCLDQLTSPLNAARLRPKRYMPKNLNTVLHISVDNQVIMEALKTKKGKDYVSEVFIISTDGREIKIFKPPKNTRLDQNCPPSFPNDANEIKSYDYQKLPKIYHNRYLVAKQFVDILRSKKPKFINNGKNGRFYVMENSPNPDMKMEFYDGGSVVEKNQKISIIDKHGGVYDETQNLDQSLQSMLQEFRREKEDWRRILKFHESLGSPNFPIVLGETKNDLICSVQKSGKENFAPALKNYRRKGDR